MLFFRRAHSPFTTKNKNGVNIELGKTNRFILYLHECAHNQLCVALLILYGYVSLVVLTLLDITLLLLLLFMAYINMPSIEMYAYIQHENEHIMKLKTFEAKL